MYRLDLFSVFLCLLALRQWAGTSAQSPALAPSPSGPINITQILEKAGQFTTFIRLLKSTQEADQIDSELGRGSNLGLTMFAPTDNAFSGLAPGTLNSLTDQDKIQLVQFHILPTFISMPQFQTVSNPLRTQVGNADDGKFPLNVTTSGSQVNLTTGVVTTTVSNTIYTDKQLAVYQVEKVLLPLAMFGTSPSPAAAPAPSEAKKGTLDSDSSSSDSSSAAHDLTRCARAVASLVTVVGVISSIVLAL